MKRREHGAGTIEERERGKLYLIKWRCKGCDRFDHVGRKRHALTVRGTYVQAQAELSRVFHPDTNAAVPPSERTFASYMEKEWQRYVDEHWRGSTQITQGSFVSKHIRPYFDHMKLADVRPLHISDFHALLKRKELSDKTRRTIHAILATMFSYAADELELISKSPVKKSMAPQVERHEKPSLSVQQAWKIWDELSAPEYIRSRAFYGVLLFTGIRMGEALGLKWEDIDFASGVFYVRRKIYRGQADVTKTAASVRPRPMTPELTRALELHKQMAPRTQPTDYVFASASGRPANPDDLRTTLQTVLRDKLKLNLGPRADGLHLLRHTSGSLVYQETKSVKHTQEWLGHSSARVTMDVYTHLMKDAQTETAKTVFQRPTGTA
jgi:integrase